MQHLEGSKNSVLEVVIPFYNSFNTVEEIFRGINAVAVTLGVSIRIIAIDDGSTDETWHQIVESAKVSTLPVTGIKLSRNFGQHSATVAGLQESQADYVIIMDCDLQDDPNYISILYSTAKTSNWDILYAQNINPQRGLIDFGSRIFHGFGNKQLNGMKRLSTFRILTRRVVLATLEYKEATVLTGPIIDQLGFRKSSVPIPRGKRSNGTRYSLRKRVNLAINFLLGQSSSITLYYVFIAACVVVFLAVYNCIALIVKYTSIQILMQESFEMVSVSTFLLGFIFIGVGIAILLLQQILFYVKGAPGFHIAEKVFTDKTD